MLNFYKNIVNRYIQSFKLNNINTDSTDEDILFMAFLDIIITVSYTIFTIFTLISLYFFISREVLPYDVSL